MNEEFKAVSEMAEATQEQKIIAEVEKEISQEQLDRFKSRVKEKMREVRRREHELEEWNRRHAEGVKNCEERIAKAKEELAAMKLADEPKPVVMDSVMKYVYDVDYSSRYNSRCFPIKYVVDL